MKFLKTLVHLVLHSADVTTVSPQQVRDGLDADGGHGAGRPSGVLYPSLEDVLDPGGGEQFRRSDGPDLVSCPPEGAAEISVCSKDERIFPGRQFPPKASGQSLEFVDEDRYARRRPGKFSDPLPFGDVHVRPFPERCSNRQQVRSLAPSAVAEKLNGESRGPQLRHYLVDVDNGEARPPAGIYFTERVVSEVQVFVWQ